jgi:glutaredoxin
MAKKITMFHLKICKYCDMARKAIKELQEGYPEYRDVDIEMIDEEEHPDIAERYDYWSVPSLFVGDEKVFEANIFMSYDDIKDGVMKAFKKALEE